MDIGFQVYGVMKKGENENVLGELIDEMTKIMKKQGYKQVSYEETEKRFLPLRGSPNIYGGMEYVEGKFGFCLKGQKLIPFDKGLMGFKNEKEYEQHLRNEYKRNRNMNPSKRKRIQLEKAIDDLTNIKEHFEHQEKTNKKSKKTF